MKSKVKVCLHCGGNALRVHVSLNLLHEVQRGSAYLILSYANETEKRVRDSHQGCLY